MLLEQFLKKKITKERGKWPRVTNDMNALDLRRNKSKSDVGNQTEREKGVEYANSCTEKTTISTGCLEMKT